MRSGGHRVFIFLGKNFVMRRKRVLVTCPRFTESEEVQLSYVGGRGRGGRFGEIHLNYDPYIV